MRYAQALFLTAALLWGGTALTQADLNCLQALLLVDLPSYHLKGQQGLQAWQDYRDL